jgi:uncharacterized protein YtpQ (UPF0354 family)
MQKLDQITLVKYFKKKLLRKTLPFHYQKNNYNLLLLKDDLRKGVCIFIPLPINKSECNVNESIFNVSLPKTFDTITDKKVQILESQSPPL